ncbi:MAG: tRNA (cytidine(34)-2'-O)-methyltransferase [Alphaproteobacteria bacterium]
MRIALFQPDIPQNTGTILRLAACTGIAADIIEPCGFVWSSARLRRAGMDYLDGVAMERHASWEAYCRAPRGRLVLLTTKGTTAFTDFAFHPDDTLLLGSESAGVPDYVHDMADARLRIPMAPAARSLNIALAAAMVLGEAMRQTDGFPRHAGDDGTGDA